MIELARHDPGRELAATLRRGIPGLAAWLQGDGDLHLFVDSLDEGRRVLAHIAELFVDALIDLPPARLRLRLTCRRADWPDSLGAELRDFFGRDRAPIILSLAPLRAEDARIAARTEGRDPDRFLRAILEQGLEPLAALPLTLKFLLDLYRPGERFPATRAGLFAQGCERLVEERNDRRRRTPTWHGNLTLTQRLAVGKRLAALSVLGRRPILMASAEDAPPNALTYAAAADAPADAPLGGLPVTEAAIDETVRTRLCAGRDAGRSGWIQQLVTDFLAASWLAESGFTVPQLVGLLAHQDGRVFPLLSDVAGWAGCLIPDLFDELVERNPDVLLRGDPAHLPAPRRAALVAALLAAAGESLELRELLHLRRYFHHLAHVDLADQVGRVALDPAAHPLRRWLALTIAQLARCDALAPVAIGLALDPQLPYELRVAGAGLAAAHGDEATSAPLWPLATVQDLADEQEELRGLALEVGWERHAADPAALFQLLSRPRWDGFGTYRRAVEWEILPRLQPHQLTAALGWLAGQRVQGRWPRFSDAIDAILGRAAEHLADPAILAGVATVIANRVERRDRGLGPHIVDISDPPGRALRAALERNPDQRRSLLDAILTRLPDPVSRAYHLEDAGLSIISREDVPWLIQRWGGNAEAPVRGAYWQLLRPRFDAADPRHMVAIEQTVAEGPGAADAERLVALLDSPSPAPVPRRTGRGEEQPTATQSPAEQLAAALARAAAAGVDRLDVWPAIRDALVAPGTADKSPVTWPGWHAADHAQRATIEQQALAYLSLGTWSAVARPYSYWVRQAIDALRLLQSGNAELLTHIPAAARRRWLITLLDYPLNFADVRSEVKALLARLVAADPDAAIADLLAFIDRYVRQRRSIPPLDRLADCARDAIGPPLLAKVTNLALTGASVEAILNLLVRWEFPGARASAAQLIAARDTGRPASRDRALGAACSLIMHPSPDRWEAIWSAMVADPSFGRALIAKLDHDALVSAPPTPEAAIALHEWLVQNSGEAEQPARPGEQTPIVGATEDNLPIADLETKGDSAHQDTSSLRALLIRRVQQAGTPEAVAALRAIGVAPATLRAAATAARAAAWRPLEPAALLSLARDRRRRPIQSGAHLFDLVLKALATLRDELQREGLVRFLWNYQTNTSASAASESPDQGTPEQSPSQETRHRYRPKDEEDLSLWLTLGLRRELAGRGFVATREPVVRRGIPGGRPGNRLDIQVEVAIPAPQPDAAMDIAGVVIEVKGDWNEEVRTSMRAQLRDQYLTTTGYKHGIFVVGRFFCPLWTRDGARTEAERLAEDFPSVEALQRHLDVWASELSDTNRVLRALVIDCGLPGAVTPREQDLAVLTALPGIGPVLAARLLDRFGSLRGVLDADAEALGTVPGIGKALAARLAALLR